MATNQNQYEEMCEVYERYLNGGLVPIVRCKDCVAYNGDHHYCYNDIFAVENGYCYNARNKEEPDGGWPDENWDVGIYHD